MDNPMYNFYSSINQRETPDPQIMSEEFGCIFFTMRSFFNSRDYKKESKCVFDLSVVKQESKRTRVTRALGKILSSIGVLQAQQPGIVSEILQVLQVAVPMLPIDVFILEQTFTYDYLAGPYIHRVSPARISRVELKPATKASIQSLEKVRIDRLEEPESLCTICSDGLAESSGDQDQLIARMPCSHLYHAHCIVKWLKINHLCPLCRYPMPISKAFRPSAQQ